MSQVELSLQLQIRDIAAVQEAFSTAVVNRHSATLWWLVDYASNIIYENRVKGSSIITIDTNIQDTNLGSTLFGDWFNLQNAYFSQDQPLVGVQSLKDAIELSYRWRVSQFFNDVMILGNGLGISPIYVFPYPTFNVGTYTASSSSAGAYTKGSGPVDITLVGPGILAITPVGANIGVNNLILALTAVYQDGTTVSLPATAPTGTTPTTTIKLGGQALTASYTASSGLGVVSVASSTIFKVGNYVLVYEDKTGSTPFLYNSEVAEVVSTGTGTMTLRQPTPAGASAPYADGLRNDYTTSAIVYPLFIDVTAVTNSNGNAGDEVKIGFAPDRVDGFVDVSTISSPQ